MEAFGGFLPGFTFAKIYIAMHMKLILRAALCSLVLIACKERPDKALVEKMKADVAKYEADLPALAQYAGSMSEMGQVLINLPAEQKAKVPHFNEEEAQMWAKVGMKAQAGVDGYTKNIYKLKLLIADYLDGKLSKDSAQVKFMDLHNGLVTMPDVSKLSTYLSPAKGSYQQMIAGIPDSILSPLKEKAAHLQEK